MLDNHVRVWYSCYHNGDIIMTNIYANVGKMGNLARSLLLIYPKIGRFYRFLYHLNNAKSLEHNPLPKLAQPEKSAKICKNLHSEQILAARPRPSVSYDPSILRVRLPHSLFLSEPYTIHHTPSTLFPFVVKSPALLTRVTGKMRTNQPHPYRTKTIVFAKKSLPDFSINSAATDNCRNRKSSFFRTFSQNLRKTRDIVNRESFLIKKRKTINEKRSTAFWLLRPLPPATPKTRKRTARGVLMQHHLTLLSANSILKNTLSGNISRLREGQGTS